MHINSSMSQIQQLFQQRRQSLTDMISSVQGGDMATAQKDLTSLQSADASLGIDESANASSSTGRVKHRIDFSSLIDAVQSGDLSSAQSAWNQIQANRAQSSQAVDPDGDGDGGGHSGITKDIASLMTAVNSGDTSSMQAAATAVAGDMQTLLQGQPQPPAGQPPQSTVSGSSTDPRQTLIDDLNAVVTAAQSGDAASAQSAQQKLVQDLQALNGEQDGPGRALGHHHHHHGAPPPVPPTPSPTDVTSTTPATDTTGTSSAG